MTASESVRYRLALAAGFLEEATQDRELGRLLLGPAQHVMTDYGDESTSTLPWDLFTRESGEEALAVATRALSLARAITARFHPPARNP